MKMNYRMYFTNNQSIPIGLLKAPPFRRFVERNGLPVLAYEISIENLLFTEFGCFSYVHELYDNFELRTRDIAVDYTKCVLANAAKKYYKYRWLKNVEI